MSLEVPDDTALCGSWFDPWIKPHQPPSPVQPLPAGPTRFRRDFRAKPAARRIGGIATHSPFARSRALLTAVAVFLCSHLPSHHIPQLEVLYFALSLSAYSNLP